MKANAMIRCRAIMQDAYQLSKVVVVLIDCHQRDHFVECESSELISSDGARWLPVHCNGGVAGINSIYYSVSLLPGHSSHLECDCIRFHGGQVQQLPA